MGLLECKGEPLGWVMTKRRMGLFGGMASRAAFITLACLPAQAALSDNQIDFLNAQNVICGTADGAVAIAACSFAIGSGQWSGAGLATLYYNRGKIYARQKDYPRAIADLKIAIGLNPNFAGAYELRGLAKGLAGDESGGQADNAIARKLDPSIEPM